MKTIIALCVLFFCFAQVGVGTAHAKLIDCGWGSWNDENYNRKGQIPPEDACPPGEETERRSLETAWVWQPVPPSDATGGRRGANRVVKATGYAGVQGKFTEPDIDDVIDVDDPTGKHKNKPTFYLGIGSGVNEQGDYYYGTIKGVNNAPKGLTKTDAGFQWEPHVSDPQRDPGNSFPGWKMFHRVTISTAYTVGNTKIAGSWNLWVDLTTRWRRNALGDTELKYQVEQGGYVSLVALGKNIPEVGILGSYSTSLQSDENGSVRVNTIDVRRVVGLTQAYDGVKELKPYGSPDSTTQAIMDGSVVAKLNFTRGYLTKVADFATNSWFAWTGSASSNGLYPNTKQDGLWVIDFAKGGPTDQRKVNGGYNTGYYAEDVEIHMGNPRKVKGKKGTNGG